MPGDVSLTSPNTVRLSGVRSVEASAVKIAPGVFVKSKRNAPFGSIVGLVRTIGVAGGVKTRISRDSLGMPFTNMVASACPIGKLAIGSDV